MKFTVKLVVILLIILICLAIFLYFLNNLIHNQKEEEEKQTQHHTIQPTKRFKKYLESFEDTTEKKATKDQKDYYENCPNVLIHRGDVIVLYNTKKNTEPIKTFKNLDEYVKYIKEQQSSNQYCPVLYLRKENDLQGRDVYRLYPFFHPSQLPWNDKYTNLYEETPTSKHVEIMPSKHYPIEDGDRWNDGGALKPAIAVPPPFLKSISGWDLHHMPPIYIEGGLPPMPIEQNGRSQPTIPVLPMPMDNIGALPETTVNGVEVTPSTNFQNFDPYEIKEMKFVDPTTAPPGVLSDNAYDTNWGGVLHTQKNVEEGKYDNNLVRPAIYPDLGFV